MPTANNKLICMINFLKKRFDAFSLITFRPCGAIDISLLRS
jgi:hypothetical protein